MTPIYGDDRLGGSSSRLPCGQRVDDLFTEIAEGRPPADREHERACPHCRAARAELQALWQPVGALAAEQVRAPADLLTHVMQRVRKLAEQGWYAVLPSAEGGGTRIAARVVGAVARLAAEEVPGITLALGGGHTGASKTPAELAGQEGEPATDVGVAGTHVVVNVDVLIEMGTSIAHVSHDIRRRVAERIAAYTGLRTTEVNITVVDVVHIPGARVAG